MALFRIKSFYSRITYFSKPSQVLLDGRVIYRTSAMKKGTWKNIYYIDEKELWEVKIKLDNPDQVRLAAVAPLASVHLRPQIVIFFYDPL